MATYLEPYDCWFDIYCPTLLAISTPERHKQAVADYLWRRQQAGDLHYETGR